ncbi:MAG: hypothetical protein JST89_19695 [Cyanobacteria bacterium SZAS-4]|nr:hypothetical protein [Cyanobacteria bacterium SZAS-4]
MTYSPGLERAPEAAPVPESNPSTERPFHEELEKQSPAVQHAEKTKDPVDSIYQWDGSKHSDSPFVKIVEKDGTIKGHDDAGNLTSVEFHQDPGKKHTYGYDDKNQLISVARTDKATGEDTHLERDEKTSQWYLKENGQAYPLPGEVDVRPNGDFAVQRQDGSWRVEDVSGNMHNERRLASGATVRINEDKSIDGVTRKDGTSFSCTYGKDGALESISETKEGKTLTWSRNEAGDFVQAGNEEVRKNLSVDQNGNIKYKTADNLDHVATGDGSHVVSAGDSKAQTTYDGEGRLHVITKDDGTSRQFDYEGNSTKVSKLTELNDKGEPVKSYERIADNEWKCMQGGQSLGNWKGDLKTGSDGSWSMFSDKDNPSNLWRNADAQGNVTYSRQNADGSKIIFDDKKKFSEIERADGTGAVWSMNGDAPRVSTIMPDGSQLQFDFDMKSKEWKCDDPTVKSSKDMPIAGTGEISFSRTDGTAVTVKTDSTTLVKKTDGTTLEYDAAQNLVACSKGGNERTFEVKDGVITAFTDHVKGQPERHVDLSRDRNVELTSNGDLVHTGADGKRQIETSDFSHVDCNEAGKPTKITTTNGAVRDIEWNPQTNQPVSITDTMKIGEKTVSRKWETAEDWKGTFAVIGEKDGKLTQKFARHDVQIDETGNYSYLSGDGKKVISKAGDGVRIADNGFNSIDVQEARERYLEVMREQFKGDTARCERLESMSNAFDTRMADTIERRLAAKEPEEKVRAEVEQRLKETYDHLSRLASSDDPKALDDKATRVILAETCMYHAMEPETVTQEGWGSCWLQSGYVPVGVGEHPNAMAKALADISLTGSFTDLKGNNYNFTRDQLVIANKQQGAGWTIESAPNTSYPSPVAHRWDATLSKMDKGAGYGGAGDSGRIRYGGGGQKEIMRRLTGDELAYVDGYPSSRAQRAALLHSGGAQRNGGPHHVATWALRKEKDQWLLIKGNQYNDNNRGDRVVAVIRNLNSWLENGESAQINKRFLPGVGGDFKVVGDAIKPSDYRPNNRPDPDDPERRFVGRRRFRFFRN